MPELRSNGKMAGGLMNRPSSTIVSAGSWGFLAAILMGLVAVYYPETYAKFPPGFEAALAVGIGTIAGYLTREKVLPIRRDIDE